MNERIALSAELLLVTVMIAYPLLSNYRRYILIRRKVLFVLKLNKNWMIYTAIISIITGLGTLFFIVVGLASVVRGAQLGLYGWILILAALAFFGNLTFLLNPMNAKTIFTEKGLISTSGNVFWHQIKGYKWITTSRKDHYFLSVVINFLGINISLLIRGLLADTTDVKVITQIIDQHLKGESRRRIA